jgi:hypothetical protein
VPVVVDRDLRGDPWWLPMPVARPRTRWLQAVANEQELL